MHVCVLSRLSETLQAVACQAPLFIGFSRQEYWSGLACPPSGDIPDPGIKPASLMSPALAGEFFTTGSTWKVLSQFLSWEIFGENNMAFIVKSILKMLS